MTRWQWAFWAAKWGAVAGLVAAAIGATTVGAMFWYWGRDLPDFDKNYRPPQVSRVLSSDGQVIGEIYSQRRTVVPYERIPKVVIQAFVAAEDASFFEHEGIDYVGMVRALFVNIKKGETAQGASTITQQVVKNMLLTRARTLKRKVQEIILARRLESSLSKDEILTLYANQIYFGHGRYGIQEAARYYYGKDVDQLNVGEAALLAGLPQGPEILSPKKEKNRERAKRRQIYVLQQMVANGYLEAVEAQKWIDEPIKIIADPFPSLGLAPEWVDVARDALVEKVGKEEVDTAGLRITTTVDLAIQATAKEALRKGLREYDERKSFGRPIKRYKANKIELELAKLARKLPKGGPVIGKVYLAIVLEVDDDNRELLVDLGEWKASVLLGGPGDERFNPDGKKPSERFGKGDLVRVMIPREERKPADEEDTGDEEPRVAKKSEREIELASGPEGAVVVIDPRTRRLLAVVGGYNYRVGDFNRALRAERQAGSTFKPFVYGAAIESGEMTAATIINDAPEVYDLWAPENYKKGEFEGPVRLRYALAKSINTVAIKVTYDLGPDRVADFAQSLGIESELPRHLSLALGSGEVTPIELTNAFASFAAGGRVAKPTVLARIGDEPVKPEPAEQILRPEVAYVGLDMMRSVVNEGTGGGARSLKMDVAGKTGTSNDVRDAWFVGMTPDLVVGVWVGYDDFRRELGRGESGGKTALPVVKGVLAEHGRRDTRFSRPPGVEEVRIDKATGLLSPEGAAPETYYNEVFLLGTAPTEIAPSAGEATTDSAIQDQYDELYEGLYDEGEQEAEVGTEP